MVAVKSDCNLVQRAKVVQSHWWKNISDLSVFRIGKM